MAPLTARLNDENAPPEQGPNDADRLRFGFAKRNSQVLLKRDASCGAVASSRPAVRQPAAHQPQAQTALRKAAPAGDEAVEVIPLVERLLGDPDAGMPLLRSKSFVSKYDFKGRISDLSEQNRLLRVAVSQHRDNYKALVDALGPVQADISWRLRTASTDLEAAKKQLSERSRLSEEVQEALRVVLRQESGQQTGRDSSISIESKASDTKACDAEVQQELEMLRKCREMEAARAERAEARVHERDTQINALRAELEAARAEVRKEKDRAQESAQLAKQQVNEAAQLLSKQIGDAAQNHRQMLAVAKWREESLIEENARMAVQVEELQAELTAARRLSCASTELSSEL